LQPAKGTRSRLPFVDIAKHDDQTSGFFGKDGQQTLYLETTFSGPQPEMRDDHSEILSGDINLSVNASARLATGNA
jgi:hypothetical protein